MIAAVILFAVLALALLSVGTLAWTRRLPGNSYVGLRVPEVRKSREKWDAAHRTAGPLWVASGMAFGFGAFLLATDRPLLWCMAVALGLGGLALLGMGASLGARNAAILDAYDDAQAAKDSTCCSAGGAPEDDANAKPAANQQPRSSAPAPQANPQQAPNLDALRQAAQHGDR